MTLATIIICLYLGLSVLYYCLLRREWKGKVQVLEQKVASRDEQIHHLQGLLRENPHQVAAEAPFDANAFRERPREYMNTLLENLTRSVSESIARDLYAYLYPQVTRNIDGLVSHGSRKVRLHIPLVRADLEGVQVFGEDEMGVPYEVTEDPRITLLTAQREAFKASVALHELGAIDKDAVERMLKDFNPQQKETNNG